jgi:hypothetical protein
MEQLGIHHGPDEKLSAQSVAKTTDVRKRRLILTPGLKTPQAGHQE